LVTRSTALVVIVVVAVAVTGTPATLSMLSTAAVFVTTPVRSLPTRATTVTVRVAPSGTVPNWHSVPAHAPPSLAVMLCSVRPVGSCSLTSTKRASLGPAFVMVTV
jgi:hypothetical protein